MNYGSASIRDGDTLVDERQVHERALRYAPVGASLRQIYAETLREPVSDDFRKLLDSLN